MKHIWTIICKSSVVDQETNNISLFDVLEKLTFTIKSKKGIDVSEQGKEPIMLPYSFELISLLEKTVPQNQIEKVEITTEFYAPDDKKIKEHKQVLEIAKNFKKTRLRQKMQGVPITKTGIYLFKVKIRQGKGKIQTVAEMPLEINIRFEMPKL